MQHPGTRLGADRAAASPSPHLSSRVPTLNLARLSRRCPSGVRAACTHGPAAPPVSAVLAPAPRGRRPQPWRWPRGPRQAAAASQRAVQALPLQEEQVPKAVLHLLRGRWVPIMQRSLGIDRGIDGGTPSLADDRRTSPIRCLLARLSDELHGSSGAMRLLQVSTATAARAWTASTSPSTRTWSWRSGSASCRGAPRPSPPRCAAAANADAGAWYSALCHCTIGGKAMRVSFTAAAVPQKPGPTGQCTDGICAAARHMQVIDAVHAGVQLHKKGCRCRKSKCLKKYCECYDAGVACSTICRCARRMPDAARERRWHVCLLAVSAVAQA